MTTSAPSESTRAPARRAIFLPADGNLTIIPQTTTSQYRPTGSQALVSVRYSAAVPADVRHFYMGLSGYVSGYEWVGRVVEVPAPTGNGSSECPYAVGDVLFGQAQYGHQRKETLGSHQDFVLAETGPGGATYKVASSSSSSLVGGGSEEEEELSEEEDALWRKFASMPLPVHTATDALFNMMGFAFPPLGDDVVDGADPRGRALLIWGGSSTVGVAAIQLAAAAGFSPIFTTASRRNHATLLELGATQCFDYSDDDVVDQIRAAAADAGPEVRLTACFDAVAVGMGFAEPPGRGPWDLTRCSPALAKRCLTTTTAGDSGEKDDVRLCSALYAAHDSDWVPCIGARDPVREPRWSARMTAVAEWVWANHETAMRVPNIEVVRGAEEGLRAIHDVFDGKYSMTKVLIQHPL